MRAPAANDFTRYHTFALSCLIAMRLTNHHRASLPRFPISMMLFLKSPALTVNIPIIRHGIPAEIDAFFEDGDNSRVQFLG
jgi:hypothetical protein